MPHHEQQSLQSPHGAQQSLQIAQSVQHLLQDPQALQQFWHVSAPHALQQSGQEPDEGGVGFPKALLVLLQTTIFSRRRDLP